MPLWPPAEPSSSSSPPTYWGWTARTITSEACTAATLSGMFGFSVLEGDPADRITLELDAGVEEGERVGGLARHLLHHDRHVAVGLLPRPAGGAEHPRDVDTDGRR